MNKIKVLVADSSQIYALGLAQSLAEDERIEVFNHVYNGRHVTDMTDEIKPDIILIDSTLLKNDGAKVLEMLHELHPDVKVIVLIPPENTKSILDKVINAGAKGILPKNVNPKELIKSVVETAEFGATIHPTMLPQILEKLVETMPEKPAIENPLSIREIEVIELVAEGKSNRAIAEILFISENTVKGHIKRICNKLNVDNRIEMARYVLLNKRVGHRENSEDSDGNDV